jgi:hypothetical protein
VGKYKRKRRKGKEKQRMGKENKKRESKRDKQMQNSEELRQKGHYGSRKPHVARGGEILYFFFFRREGGIYIVFGPKYRPLMIAVAAAI